MHASLRNVLSIAQDYDHHREYYKPDIEDAKIESRQGDDFLVYMRIVKSKFLLSDVLKKEHAIQFIRVLGNSAGSPCANHRGNPFLTQDP